MISKLYYSLIIIIMVVIPVWAQHTPEQVDKDNQIDRPTEYGIRFTPAMARFLGGQIAEKLVNKYQLDKEKVEEAAELLARRIMQAAHASEENNQELFEFVIAESLNMANNDGRQQGVPLKFGMGFGKRILPLMPAIRDLIRHLGQDLRPMLSLKQQLKFGADLMTVSTALDAFENNMNDWSKGQIDTQSNPFKPKEDLLVKNEKGESKALQQAANRANTMLNASRQSEWKKYVQEAKQFYKLEEAQSASADSVLREIIERAEVIQKDGIRRENIHRNRTWYYMMRHLHLGPDNPLRSSIDWHMQELADPMNALEEELKKRIDDIPTQAQRNEVENNIKAALAEYGYQSDEHENEQ